MSIVKLESGDNLDLEYTIIDQDGDVVDLTDGTLTWVAYINGTDTVVINKTGTLTTPASGMMTVYLIPSDTVSLDGVYSVLGKFTDSAGSVFTYEDGGLVVQ